MGAASRQRQIDELGTHVVQVAIEEGVITIEEAIVWTDEAQWRPSMVDAVAWISARRAVFGRPALQKAQERWGLSAVHVEPPIRDEYIRGAYGGRNKDPDEDQEDPPEDPSAPMSMGERVDLIADIVDGARCLSDHGLREVAALVERYRT